MNNTIMNFDLPRETQSSMIKVIGVGGGGCNAVDHMYRQGIKGVDFIVCNTDQQALDKSPVPTKVVLGVTLTEGLGAGSNPEVGKNSAIETIEEIKTLLDKRTKMIFITAGMGGGTGTGAAPVIAHVAKEMGILTVGIVTIPFGFEGKRRKQQAEEGIEELKRNVDTLLIICNDKLREIYGNLKMSDAFGHADNILTTGAKGIAEIITEKLHINTDFADIQTVLKDSGVAIMGSAESRGENRALDAVEKAMNSPLLNDSNIKGARHVLLNVKCGAGDHEINMDEFDEITAYLQNAAGGTAEVIMGWGIDESLEDKVIVTIIATGFNNNKDLGVELSKPAEKIVNPLYGNTAQVKTTESITNQPIPQNNDASKVVFNLDETNTAETEEVTVNQLTKSEYPSRIFTFASEASNMQTEKLEDMPPKAQIVKNSNTRVERVNTFSWRSNRNQDELEKTPAYMRKQVQLDQVPHSSDSQVSRYSLTEGEDNQIEIKTGNSFLHDNVD